MRRSFVVHALALPALAVALLAGAAGVSGLAGAPTAAAASPAANEYHGVTPRRYLDTRPGEATFDGAFGGNGRMAGNAGVVALAVGGRGEIPADAVAVALNVTATDATANGYVTVWPCNAKIPTASNLNYTRGQTVANAVISGADFEGRICLYAKAPVHVVVDVVGYFPATSTYRPLVPQRLHDSRFGPCNGAWNSSEVAGFAYPLYAADAEPECTSPYPDGPIEVPADAEAAVLNLTAVTTAGAGYIATRDCQDKTGLPRTSTVNFDRAGQVLPNLAVAPITNIPDDPGSMCFDQKASGHFVIDAFGYFPAGSGYTAANPVRLVDTRPTGTTVDGIDARTDRLGRFAERAFSIAGRNGGAIPSVGAAVVNVTVTGADQAGWVALYPCGTEPSTSTINYGAGRTLSNAAFVTPGAGGQVCYQASQPVHVIVDLAGWF